MYQALRYAEDLSVANADLFHRVTAKLLFLWKRARPDIQTAVAFLCQGPNANDYDVLEVQSSGAVLARNENS